MKAKAKIMDEQAVCRAMARITHEIIERNQGVEDICLLGVKRKGVPLAMVLHDNILRFENVNVPLGYLDITAHRDDLSESEKMEKAKDCFIPCDVKDKTVIIVDDVLFTGRTARAALEAVFHVARPKVVQLAVLIDRGHRELPIRPDYIGKNVPTSKHEKIVLVTDSSEGDTGVFICDEE